MGAGSLLKGLDNLVSEAYLKWCGERPALLSFLFHGMFEDAAEIEGAEIAPMQGTTVPSFRAFVEYFLSHGYTFVSHLEVLSGLAPGRKYALITFDDGYYNNLRALPVLKEFGVPAIFFISSNHVERQKCFWWDVLHRESRKRGSGPAEIEAEGNRLKSRTNAGIEARLVELFGPDCLRPLGDLDRPFLPRELSEFARAPGVHIGNHTCDHAILTNYSPEEARRQIAGAQESLAAMTGAAPISIAYPNGNFSREILEISRECGLEVGFTLERRKIPLGIGRDGGDLMRLGRFMLQERGNRRFQLNNFRSDVSPYGWLKAMSTSRY